MALTTHVRRLFGTHEPSSPYECHRCGAQFKRNRQVCPDCDSFYIERTSYTELLD